MQAVRATFIMVVEGSQMNLMVGKGQAHMSSMAWMASKSIEALVMMAPMSRVRLSMREEKLCWSLA